MHMAYSYNCILVTYSHAGSFDHFMEIDLCLTNRIGKKNVPYPAKTLHIVKCHACNLIMYTLVVSSQGQSLQQIC